MYDRLDRKTDWESLHTSDNLEIDYHPRHHILYCKWIGLQTNVKESGELIFYWFQQRRCCKVLNDNLRKTGFWDDSVKWAVKEWFPKMEAAGLLYFAWIFPPDMKAYASASRAIKETKVVKAFTDYDEAYAWLCSIPDRVMRRTPHIPLTRNNRSIDPHRGLPGKVSGKYHNAAREIFIVCGRDSTAKDQLELILHKLNLKPFVLSPSTGEGSTLIRMLQRKIGKKGSLKYGIVLLTPDDMGYLKTEGLEAAKPRARQNVVLEMGMLLSSVGERNTFILKKGELEDASDMKGLIYLPFTDHVKETVPALAARLQNAGFHIDSSWISDAMC